MRLPRTTAPFVRVRVPLSIVSADRRLPTRPLRRLPAGRVLASACRLEAGAPRRATGNAQPATRNASRAGGRYRREFVATATAAADMRVRRSPGKARGHACIARLRAHPRAFARGNRAAFVSCQQLATHNPQPATHHPQPATRHSPLATRNPQLATRNSQLATRNSQLATRNPQPATRNPQPASRHRHDHILLNEQDRGFAAE